MPSVEYTCQHCGHLYKRIIFMGDKEEKPLCPKCKSADVVKSPSASRLFKGISNLSSMAKDTN
ncbi:MAG: zinc ribbon domain-containing protein [Desulfobacterales bacterium]|nr:zinc ribbon domain-containing protein [Desulfobacterales bacterium]